MVDPVDLHENDEDTRAEKGSPPQPPQEPSVAVVVGDANNPQEVETEDEIERRLDYELFIIQRMNAAFTASLHMMVTIRDDLIEMGNRMDRLSRASQLCREALQARQEQEQAKQP